MIKKETIIEVREKFQEQVILQFLFSDLQFLKLHFPAFYNRKLIIKSTKGTNTESHLKELQPVCVVCTCHTNVS